MSDKSTVGLVGLYKDADKADDNLDVLIALSHDLVIQPNFDAAVARKNADGSIEIAREHRQRGLFRERPATHSGFAEGLFVSLLPAIESQRLARGRPARPPVPPVRAHGRKALDDQKAAFTKMADDALESGEAILCVVCPAESAPRVDHLMTNAKNVVTIDLRLPTDRD